MVPALTEADLEPFTASGLSWRWRDVKYDILPDGVLRSIRALRRDGSRRCFPQSLLIDAWIRDRPAREIDIEAHDANFVSEWLREHVSDAESVIASWSDEEALYLPWAVFSEYWSSFCYPGSDDVTVWPPDEQWGLSFSHSGVFYWRGRTEDQGPRTD